ncbi:hypothetical protein EUX98_g2573 [Antrodiella citrinella]|uniref:Peptidase C15, pyroglutamyl peptidase I-like protein n=1 Tax=Antrodiella citrinella TaxID=2447956 RepID=A0A4S4MYL9_9APHY|nr:hypothetical protein EUX98_g2573 [Antrodiella citrinella]
MQLLGLTALALALASTTFAQSTPITLTGAFTCATAGAFTLCQNQWGTSAGVGSQNSTLLSASGNSISWSTSWTWANGPNNVKTYANVLHNSAKGMQLSAITAAPTSWQWQYNTISSNIRADVSYDIWFGEASSGTPASSASSYEMLHDLALGIQPVGSQIVSNIEVAGHSWNLWRGPNSNWTVLSFVSANGDLTDFEVDLKDFFEYLISNEGVAATQYLQAIQTGTEPFVGTADLVIENFSVSVIFTMPVLPQSQELDSNAIRVLITGFGPFSIYKAVNPSWLAVRALHNTILYSQSPTVAVSHNDKPVESPPSSPQQIHITAVEIATSYDAVLSHVPGLHKSPPVVPVPDDPSYAIPPPPEKGYDFIMHVGVAPTGHRLEKLAHKTGYLKPDALGKLAPEVLQSQGEKGSAETPSTTPTRGFADGYESFPGELHSQVDVDGLLKNLKEAGAEPSFVSIDAGRYLCDFIYYCSLAEAQRHAVDGETPTPVFFLHCSPVGQPHSTQATTDAIKRIVTAVCAGL